MTNKEKEYVQCHVLHKNYNVSENSEMKTLKYLHECDLLLLYYILIFHI